MWWKFFAGLGLFLYGLSTLENALKYFAGQKFTILLKKFTSTPFKGIIAGTISTAILQSSSVVTLMLLAFVGAGIMELSHALGVVLGANLGTTFTGWVVSTLGFKVDLKELIFPMMAISALGSFLLSRYKSIFHSLISFLGLSLLLLGLFFMKESMEVFSQNFDVSTFQNFNLFYFLIFGFFFTALIQSSSAIMMITLTALNGGIIELQGATALVIGADLGTSVTTILGASYGTNAKKQIAAAHFIFNLVIDIVAFILINQLLFISQKLIPSSEPLYQLVFIHSTFNFIGIILFFPFLNKFSAFIKKLFPIQKENLEDYLLNFPHEVPEAAVETIRQELLSYSLEVLTLSQEHIGIKEDKAIEYSHLKHKGEKLLGVILSTQKLSLNDNQSAQVLGHARAIDHLLYCIKYSKDIAHNIEEMNNSVSDFDKKLISSYKDKYTDIFKELIESLYIDETTILYEKLSDVVKKIISLQESTITEIHEHLKRHINENSFHNVSRINVSKEITNSLLEFIKAQGNLKLSQESYSNLKLLID